MHHQCSVPRRRQLKPALIKLLACAVALCGSIAFNACGGNQTGSGPGQGQAGAGATPRSAEETSAYTGALSAHLRKNYSDLYFSKNGGSLSLRDGAVWVTLPFAGKESALETCNAVAKFAASPEAPFAVPDVKVEAGPEPGSGSTKPSATAKGAAGGNCTLQ